VGRRQQVCLWLTPKIFPDFADPLPRVREFFDHYAEWTSQTDLTTVVFCAGNGDHPRPHWSRPEP
jgi:hypothetical protein